MTDAIRVKPLVWDPSIVGKPWHSAKAPWGWYYAQWDDETKAWFASLEMGEVEAPIILSPSDVPTLEAAKAAAQSDYEARIRSALEPVSVQEAARARSQAIVEFCAKAGISPLQQVNGLPDDVKAWRLDQAVAETKERRARDRAALRALAADKKE